MALVYADSYEHEDSSRYSSVTLWEPQAGRNDRGTRIGDYNGSFATGASHTITLTDYGFSGATLICGFAVKFVDTSNSGRLCQFSDTGTLMAAVYGGTSGWSFVNADGTILNNVGTGVVADVWYWVEFKVTFHDTTGTVEIRVNGQTMGSASSTDTSPSAKTTVTSVVFGGSQDGVDIRDGTMDDLVIMDGTGSQMNDWIGDSWVQYLIPVSDSSVGLTGSDADQVDNYDLVNETIPASSDYVGGSTATDKDYYTLDGISTALTWVVHGAQLWGLVGKESGGNAYGRVIASDGTTSAGDSIGLSTDYVYTNLALPTSPDGSTWTTSLINALEVGFEVRSST